MKIEQPDTLCPFSKAIIGGWCECPLGRVSDRCGGIMQCTGTQHDRNNCIELIDTIREKAAFTIAIPANSTTLTHSQAMKIKCGGTYGIARELLQQDKSEPVSIRKLINAMKETYRDFSSFPYEKIIQDIAQFSHRNKSRPDTDEKKTKASVASIQNKKS